uniref:B30.2/SPRY domain-containing protein n=1 Tax=Labrus bergylta TaxID=56723 RepID=A0A3Q3EAV2_9LABR
FRAVQQDEGEMYLCPLYGRRPGEVDVTVISNVLLTVDVRLDPATAHQHLILSDDGKEVIDGEEDQRVPDSPERFDVFGSVLGLNRLTSGKSYWEVEVRNKTGWDLGVARGDANRKSKLTLTPDNGYWVTVHYDDEKYAALTSPPVLLSLTGKPQKVGVFVDYEEGLVLLPCAVPKNSCVCRGKDFESSSFIILAQAGLELVNLRDLNFVNL